MSGLIDMSLKNSSDGFRGSEYRPEVKPITAVTGTNASMLSEEIGQSTGVLFGMRVLHGSDVLHISGGVIHNTWVNEQFFRLKKDAEPARFYLHGKVKFPVGSYLDGSTTRSYRKPGPISVRVFFVRRPSSNPLTSSSGTLAEDELFRYLGEVRRATTDAERAKAVRGWFVDADSNNHIASPRTHISVLPLRISYFGSPA